MEEIIELLVRVRINYDVKSRRREAIKKAKDCVTGSRIYGTAGCIPKSAKIYVRDHSKSPRGHHELKIIPAGKDLFPSPFRKIPIIISKYSDDRVKGWRVEIADSYKEYKTAWYEDINFEDVGFHFFHGIETHASDEFVFYRRKDAVECAKEVNKKYLGGKAKIWFV